MSPDMASDLLVIPGGAFEIAGLAWIVRDAARSLREEHGVIFGPHRRLWRSLRYWLFEQPPPNVVQGEAHLHGVSSSRVRRPVRVLPAESPLAQLQRELEEVRDRLDGHVADAAAGFSKMDERLGSVNVDLKARVRRLDERDRARRLLSLRQDMWGSRLFILGAFLSTLANLV